MAKRGGLQAAVALQVLEALPSVLRDPTQAPAEPVRLQDTGGQARPSLN